MNEQCAAQVKPSTPAWRFRRYFVVRFQTAYRVLQLLFLRIFYRHIMRLSHYFGWHYAPLKGPFPGGNYYRWCQWCGLRGDVYTEGPLKRIDAAGERQEEEK